MVATRFYAWIEKHQRTIHLFMAPMLIFFLVGVYALVYMTGGIKYVYSHSMYIPILLSGFVFGIRGGVLIGLFGGIALGHFMPIDVITGEPQKMLNWLYRTGFFTLIGFIVGAASDSIRSYISHLKWLSRHDVFSNLPNQYALIDQLEKYRWGEENISDAHILILISIENEMELLSTFGTGVIDAAILQLVKYLEEPASHNTFLFRTGEAQIGVLNRNVSSQGNEDFIDELSTVLRKPIWFEKIPIHIDARVGYVSITEPESPELYLQKARYALTEARIKARDHVAYSPALHIANRETLVILGELQNAFTEKQLSLHYQPKVVISTGAVHGVEALMRWNHPERGNISPGLFIPRAEESTLINQITDLALDQAMAQMVLWRQHGINIPTAVNISTRNLLQPGFTNQLFRLLEHYGLSGEQLELEVTESALMLDIQNTIDVLTNITDAKIIVSIDDFGTGYSSLQYLHDLPVSFIKIDQSFVRRLPSDKSAISIVESTVNLAHNMGMKTIAEGIENRETYDFLENIGCDIAQGFMISRPLPAEEYTKWYTQNNGCFR